MKTDDTPITVWMRCPYHPDLCGTDATLTDFQADDTGWSGVLVCANGHEFGLSQVSADDQGSFT